MQTAYDVDFIFHNENGDQIDLERGQDYEMLELFVRRDKTFRSVLTLRAHVQPLDSE